MKKICSVILAVVMVASLFLMSACGGAKEPTKFDSPQARYEYVADKEVKKIAEPVLTQYSEATENVNGKKISAQINVEFGKDLKELLTSTLLSVDLPVFGLPRMAMRTGCSACGPSCVSASVTREKSSPATIARDRSLSPSPWLAEMRSSSEKPKRAYS